MKRLFLFSVFVAIVILSISCAKTENPSEPDVVAPKKMVYIDQA